MKEKMSSFACRSEKKQVKQLRRKETMKLRVLVVAMCVALLVVPAAFAELSPTLSLSGDVETNTTLFGDNTEERADIGQVEQNSILAEQSGRVRLTIDGSLESDTGLYAAAKAQSILGMNGIATTDDAWIEIGKGTFGYRIGRYEFEGLYSKGNDILLATPPNVPGVFYQGRYEGNYARGRFATDIDNHGLTWDGERNFFQIGIVYGGVSSAGPTLITTTDPETGAPVQQIVQVDIPFNAIGFRPVYKYKGDVIQFRIGFDSLFYRPQNDKILVDIPGGGSEYIDNDAEANFYGGAGDLQWGFGAGKLGISLAYGIRTPKTATGQDDDEVTQFSSFLWMTFPVREADEFGFGIEWENQETDEKFSNPGVKDKGTNFGGYLSYIQQLSVESLKIKYAAAFAQTNASSDAFEDFTSTRWGLRVRLNYDF
jgi:hypothetical protein